MNNGTTEIAGMLAELREATTALLLELKGEGGELIARLQALISRLEEGESRIGPQAEMEIVVGRILLDLELLSGRPEIEDCAGRLCFILARIDESLADQRGVKSTLLSSFRKLFPEII